MGSQVMGYILSNSLKSHVHTAMYHQRGLRRALNCALIIPKDIRLSGTRWKRDRLPQSLNLFERRQLPGQPREMFPVCPKVSPAYIRQRRPSQASQFGLDLRTAHFIMRFLVSPWTSVLSCVGNNYKIQLLLTIPNLRNSFFFQNLFSNHIREDYNLNLSIKSIFIVVMHLL